MVGESARWSRKPSSALTNRGSPVWLAPLPAAVTTAVPLPASSVSPKLEVASVTCAFEPGPAVALTSTPAPEAITLRASTSALPPPDADAETPTPPLPPAQAVTLRSAPAREPTPDWVITTALAPTAPAPLRQTLSRISGGVPPPAPSSQVDGPWEKTLTRSAIPRSTRNAGCDASWSTATS